MRIEIMRSQAKPGTWYVVEYYSPTQGKPYYLSWWKGYWMAFIWAVRGIEVKVID